MSCCGRSLRRSVHGAVPQDTAPGADDGLAARRAVVGSPIRCSGPANGVHSERIAIEKLDGTVVAERRASKDSFAGHQMNTPWDALQRAHFNGEALWTYLTAPFLLAMPGVFVEETDTRKRTPGRRVPRRGACCGHIFPAPSKRTAWFRTSFSGTTYFCAARL